MVPPAGRGTGRAARQTTTRSNYIRTRLHGVAGRAGKVEGRRFLRLKFLSARCHDCSHAGKPRRVAGPGPKSSVSRYAGRARVCRSSQPDGGFDIDSPDGGPMVRIQLPPAANLQTFGPSPKTRRRRIAISGAAPLARTAGG